MSEVSQGLHCLTCGQGRDPAGPRARIGHWLVGWVCRLWGCSVLWLVSTHLLVSKASPKTKADSLVGRVMNFGSDACLLVCEAGS